MKSLLEYLDRKVDWTLGMNMGSVCYLDGWYTLRWEWEISMVKIPDRKPGRHWETDSWLSSWKIYMWCELFIMKYVLLHICNSYVSRASPVKCLYYSKSRDIVMIKLFTAFIWSLFLGKMNFLSLFIYFIFFFSEGDSSIPRSV